MPLVCLPRLEVIAGGEQTKAGLCRRLAELHEFRDGELFVTQHEADQLRSF